MLLFFFQGSKKCCGGEIKRMSKNWIVSQLILDSQQLLKRYRVMFDEFDAFQVGRSKSFVDLLMAYETILKAILIDSDVSSNDRELHNLMKHYGHNVNNMVNKLPKNVPQSLKNRHPCELTEAYFRVDLRYAIESYWFRDAYEQSYYSTVSDYDWMDALESLVDDYIGLFSNSKNAPDSISSDPLSLEELNKVEYNPYRNQISN